MPFLLKPLTENAEFSGSLEIPEGVGSYSVGRLRDNDLTIQHESVSGLHARLEASGANGVDVVDCRSSNGTFVNGEKVERCGLNEGDLVRFASAKFRVEAVGPEPAVNREKEKAELQAEIQLLHEKLSHEAQVAEERIAKLSTELSETRQASLEKERQVATLQFEVSRQETAIQQAEEKLQAANEEMIRWEAAHSAAGTELEQHRNALAAENERAASLQSRLDSVLSSMDELAEKWREDWSFWSSFEKTESVSHDEDLLSLNRLDGLRQGIREQLDLIEPLWKEYGDEVKEELRARCDTLDAERKRIEAETEKRQSELSDTESELARLREEVDREVRRAQGLSRRNVEVEIPERYEAMVIARDREKELFLAIIEQVEFFERLIDGYRRSKKMKEAIYELEDFKKRLIAILEENGVESFELESGLFLTLKQRPEVRVFGRKGWGTREYIEQPFQPGKVMKVIRCGYRAGSGDSAVILRKVEVLIQEAEG